MIKMRPYQEEAVINARTFNWQGLLEMATGTGKTFTSLFIADDFFDKLGKSFVVVVVPFDHLIDQWFDSLNNFNYDRVLSLQGGYRVNQEYLLDTLQSYRRGFLSKVACIVTYNSFIDEDFQNKLKTMPNNLFLIADECHNFGTSSYQKKDFSYIPYRLGLSATPIRKFDEEGTEYIENYFKNIILEISLDKAINRGHLTPYSYEYFLCNLNDQEFNEHVALSRTLAALLNKKDKSAEDKIRIKNTMIKRSQIIKSAENKVEVLISHLSTRNLKSLSHILIYCAVGTIDDVTKRVSNLGLRVHKFDHRINSKKRQEILKAFDDGHIQILLAMHCLDEGVDVPATKEAYFLASTSNPREFIQRRGRVLRNYPNKKEAKIYDFIVLAPPENISYSRKILMNELPRFIEFSDQSLNKYKSFNKMLLDLSIFSLDDCLLKARKDYYEKN